MANKIVLISDDRDFFDYIRAKLSMRKSDELFTFTFDELPEKLHLLKSSVIIVNSETSREKTLDLLNLIKDIPVIVSTFNDDEKFRAKCYRAGAFDYLTILVSDSEFQARLVPAFTIASILEKNTQYRDLLVDKNIITKSNDVYLDYRMIIDKELKKIQTNLSKAVFGAISPSDKTKFLIHPTIIESVILSNIRKNDILMTYAPNKYFILLKDIDINDVNKLWDKIELALPQKLFAGFVTITNQKSDELINKALNALHFSINKENSIINIKNNPVQSLSSLQGDSSTYTNFKMFRQEFSRKIERVITPVFYQVQQKYSNKLSNVTLQQGVGEGYGSFYIKGKTSSSSFRITSPGFSKINIDITYQKDSENIDAKRITLEPEELEAGLLGDLLEQFILEYCEENN